MKNILLFLVLLAGISLSSEVINFAPTGDIYTDVEHAGTPNVINELWTANYVPNEQYQRININFDLAEYLNDSVASAILNITRFYSCPSGGSTVVKVYPIAQEWDEGSWNIHQHLAYHEENYLELNLSGPGGISIKEFNIDLTEIVNEVIDNNLDFNGFVMIANNNQKFSKFYSKEHSNVNYRPSLDITTNPVSNGVAEVVDVKLNLNAYPNPFNPTTTLEFDNPNHQKAEISFYNLRGRLIRTMKNIEIAGDKSKVTWDGRDKENKKVSSGIYFCKVKVGTLTATQKLVLQK